MLSALLLLVTITHAEPCAPASGAGELGQHLDAALDELSALPAGALNQADLEQALSQIAADGDDVIAGFAALLGDGVPRSVDGAVVAALLTRYAPDLAAALPLDALTGITSDGVEVTLDFSGGESGDDTADITIPAAGDRTEMAVRITRPVTLQITPDGFRGRQLGALRIASGDGRLPTALLSLRSDAGAVLRFNSGEAQTFPLPAY